MKKILNWLKNEESGQGMVEYGLIIALVAIIAVVTLSPLGTKVAAVFTSITSQLP
ncbi:Flp family type IVb pilin [Anaerovorax sp. IOR16]|uniref:Flp family type IVb pilin n=1 Tax=Anaerovorax sp. IOR16 TaxID=2773458 RepID=UPI0019D15A8A|nr:Flp family type IVb pilin [Anaerovorax sp. IOR16]MEA4986884.1 Flp family type IVb pilin [Anaerovorax sp.]